MATVTLPEGSMETLELLDQGRDASGRGDDVGGDGIFTGVYKNTAQTGPYNFLIRADIEGWLLGHDAHEYRGDNSKSTRFVREVRLTAAVGDPKEPVLDPEDGPPGVGVDTPLSRCCRIIVTLLVPALLLLLEEDARLSGRFDYFSEEAGARGAEPRAFRLRRGRIHGWEVPNPSRDKGTRSSLTWCFRARTRV